MSSGANMQTGIYASRSAARVCLIGVIVGDMCNMSGPQRGSVRRHPERMGGINR